MISILEVDDRERLERFVELPWKLYAGDHNWVPPLKRDVRQLLDFDSHPFWTHARGALFLAELNGRTVGRISAQVDDNYNNLWHEHLGSFGFFESVNDTAVARALFAAAEEWVRRQGSTAIRGPMSPSSNEEWGFLVEGYDRPPVLMMPYNPPYYLDLAEDYGFRKAKDLLAFFGYVATPIPERLTRLARKLRDNPHISLRPVRLNDLKHEMPIIKELYNASWQKNWGFSPMTGPEMDLLAESLKNFAVPEMVLFAFYDGKPAGLSITLPDFNQVLRHLDGKLGLVGLLKFLYYRRKITGARAIVFGFKPEYRRLGLPVLMYHETLAHMRKAGYQWCELSWNLEDNRLINEFDTELGAEVYKRYRVVEKQT